MINVLRNPYIAVSIQPVQIPDRAGLLYRSIAVWFLRFVYGVLLQYLLTSGIGFNVAFDRRKASVGLFMRKQRCLCHTYIYIYILLTCKFTNHTGNGMQNLFTELITRLKYRDCLNRYFSHLCFSAKWKLYVKRIQGSQARAQCVIHCYCYHISHTTAGTSPSSVTFESRRPGRPCLTSHSMTATW